MHTKDVPTLPQVDATHYQFTRYVDLKRWASYWYQLSEVLDLEPRRVLEIGIGARVFSTMMRLLGVAVDTIDTDLKLGPDCVASALHLPFGNDHYDVVACFQVLEHLPYEQFVPALREMRRVSAGSVVLSLPDASGSYGMEFSLPRLGTGRIRLPLRRPPWVHTFDGQHYWEIGKKGYSVQTISEDIRQAGLVIRKDYRPWEQPRHRFFVLSASPGIQELKHGAGLS